MPCANPSGRILLIDDEPSLLRLMSTYLTRLGYEVLAHGEFANGMAALNNGSNVTVAIIDLSVLDGTAPLVDIGHAHPQLRVLVCSGSIFETGAVPDELRPRFAFLQKPFLPNMLAKALEELIERPLPTSI